MSSARVHSLQVLKDVKAAIAEFSDGVNQTMAGVDADINRITQWLSQDRPAYWKAQVRRREDEVTKAQADIMRKRIISAPEPASIVEEQKTLDRAKRRVEHARKKLANVRHWAPVWEREAMLYKTTCRGLAEAVHRDMPAAAARLESMMNSIDAYLRIAVPQTDGETAPTPTAEQGDQNAEIAEPPAGPGQPAPPEPAP